MRYQAGRLARVSYRICPWNHQSSKLPGSTWSLFIFIVQQGVWPAGFQRSIYYSFYPQFAFEYLCNFGLPRKLHILFKARWNVWIKEMERSRKSLSKDQSTRVNISFELLLSLCPIQGEVWKVLRWENRKAGALSLSATQVVIYPLQPSQRIYETGTDTNDFIHQPTEVKILASSLLEWGNYLEG